MNETIQGMTATLTAQLQEKVQAVKAMPEMAEILTLHRALNGLEDAIPRERTSLAEIFGLEGEVGGGAARRGEVKPWEFTGMGPLQAAKLYLKKVGEPRSIDDIATAIRAGGGNPGSVDHLKTALTRSTFDVVKVNDDMYGPIEAFPHIKRTGRWNKKKGASASAASQPAEEEEEAEEGEEEEIGEGQNGEEEVPAPRIASSNPDTMVEPPTEEGEDE